MTPIQDLISQQDKEAILSIYRPQHVTYSDTPQWKGSPNGNYSIAAAYQTILDQDSEGNDWQWVWKIKVPHRIKSFLWLVMYGRLLTNHMRFIRN